MSRCLSARAIAAVLWALTPAVLATPPAPGYDLLIEGGTLIDGTGRPRQPGNVLVRDGRIVRIGRFEPPAEQVARRIDARGRIVSPGFIDTHAHGDPLSDHAFDNFLAMGVTTVCLGQDGSSPSDLADWMARAAVAELGTDVAMFIGHGTVRDHTGVGLQPNPTEAQLAAMQGLVDEAMKRGCFGLTTGLEYQPGSFADVDELARLAEPVARAGGLVMSHLRTEDNDGIAAALDELLEQGRRAGCPVHVSHIKVIYGQGAPRAARLLARMADARRQGQRVTADLYPYQASYTGIALLFPEWAKPPHDYADIVRTRRADLADFLRRKVAARNGPQATLLGTGTWRGLTLAQAADRVGKPFEDLLIDDIGLYGADAAYFVMDRDLQEHLLADPFVMICSDGSPTTSHPRGHGAFARIIRRYVQDEGLLTLEAAIHKMTGLPAETIGLDRLRRGRLAEGWAADILVFDPARVRDNASYEHPHAVATGFDAVIVNGRLVRAGEGSVARPAGRLLRRAGSDRPSGE